MPSYYAKYRSTNGQALLGGVLKSQTSRFQSRLLSAYRTLHNVRLWVISEACDEGGNRLATTICRPEEY